MPRFACPDCGSEIIQKRKFVVSFRSAEVTAWNEDGTPAEVDEPHFEEEGYGGQEVAERLMDELLDGKPYECGACGVPFGSADELKRLD